MYGLINWLPAQAEKQIVPMTEIKTEIVKSVEVKCEDGTTCPEDNMCCKTSTGKFACCAYGNVSTFCTVETH